MESSLNISIWEVKLMFFWTQRAELRHSFYVNRVATVLFAVARAATYHIKPNANLRGGNKQLRDMFSDTKDLEASQNICALYVLRNIAARSLIVYTSLTILKSW